MGSGASRYDPSPCVLSSSCPTYNERRTSPASSRPSARHAPAADVLVVDDNSPDGTAERGRGRRRPSSARSRSCTDPASRDSAAPIATGSRSRSTRDTTSIVTMDVDFSHDPAVIPTMLGSIEAGADVVVGSRYVAGRRTVNWPFHRRLLSRWGNRYAALRARPAVRDCTSGFRAYRATALRAIEPATTTAEGYAFLTELVRRLAKGGFVIAETPITFRRPRVRAPRRCRAASSSSRCCS